MMSNNAFIQLLQYASLRKSRIFFASLFSILNKICDIFPEILIGIAIDIIVNQGHAVIAPLGITNPFYQLYLTGALAALMWTFESIFEYLYSIAWRSLAQDVQHELRLKTYATIQRCDLAYFENKTTGQLLNILQDDINQLEQFLSQSPNEIIQLIVNVIVMGCIFFYLSPMLAILTLLPIPCVIGTAYYFQHKLAYLYETVRQTFSNLTSHITYRLQGMTTIKSYTTELYELDFLRQESNLYQKANHNANRISALYVPAIRMIIMVGFIMALVVGGIYSLQGIIQINWYAALVFLTQRFLWPFASLTAITDMYERSLACAKRILAILTQHRTILDGSKHLLINNTVAGAIQFKNVCFSYDNGMQIFDTINFEIPAKKTVAFIGSTGSGKSTIVKLLLRFYDSQSGLISIDNDSIKDITLHDLRKSIALVSQDVYMVDGTIADNIAYGSFKASGDAIVEAAKMAHAHDFIIELPEGYNTKVQEYGKNLSGGQKQRLSIARAILKNAPIFIFDEATSAIDNETDAAISQSMMKLKKNHTIIIIAHRLSSVRNADTIFVLEKGAIVEQGDHDTLLQKNGFYANLWKA
jgi:ATP-binding cassette subfamily B protein